MRQDHDYAAVFSDAPGTGEPLGVAARPWPRFWARRLDIAYLAFVLSFALGMAVGLFAPEAATSELLTGPLSNLVWGIAVMPLVFLADSLIAAVFGNTFGKWIVGIRIATPTGRRLTLLQVMKRNLGVYTRGLGLGIPIVSLFTQMISYNQAQDGGGLSPWDKAMQTMVVDAGVSGWRVTAAAACTIATFGLGIYLAGPG